MYKFYSTWTAKKTPACTPHCQSTWKVDQEGKAKMAKFLAETYNTPTPHFHYKL